MHQIAVQIQFRNHRGVLPLRRDVNDFQIVPHARHHFSGYLRLLPVKGQGAQI